MAACAQLRLPILDAVGDAAADHPALPSCLGECSKLKSCHVLSGAEVEALLQPVAPNALRAETIRLQCFGTCDAAQLHEHFNDYITQPLCLVAACGGACVGFKFVISSGSCVLEATLVVPPDFPSRPSIAVVNSVTVGSRGELSEVRRHVEAEVNHALLADLSHACSGQLPPSTLALQVFLPCIIVDDCCSITRPTRCARLLAALPSSATARHRQQPRASSQCFPLLLHIVSYSSHFRFPLSGMSCLLFSTEEAGCRPSTSTAPLASFSCACERYVARGSTAPRKKRLIKQLKTT